MKRSQNERLGKKIEGVKEQNWSPELIWRTAFEIRKNKEGKEPKELLLSKGAAGSDAKGIGV